MSVKNNNNVEKELEKLRRVAAVAKRYQNAVAQKRTQQAFGGNLQDIELEIGDAEFELLDKLQEAEHDNA